MPRIPPWIWIERRLKRVKLDRPRAPEKNDDCKGTRFRSPSLLDELSTDHISGAIYRSEKKVMVSTTEVGIALPGAKKVDYVTTSELRMNGDDDMYSCLFEGRAGKLFPWSSAAVAFTGSYIRIPESHLRGLLILLTSPLSNVRCRPLSIPSRWCQLCLVLIQASHLDVLRAFAPRLSASM